MIPFLDLKAQLAAIRPDIDAALAGVLDSGQFVLGPAVAGFETAFARYCGTEHAVALNSGTSALHLALLAAGVRPDDEVITVPMTFVATVAAIRYANARPVFVDVDPQTWTMDPSRLEAVIGKRTRAIIPVHLHGLTADMDPIREIADRHGIAVIEDAAQSHGARYKDRPAGSLGRIGCFSFYPGKNLGAYGEGGAITTDDADVAQAARMYRDWGQARKYEHVMLGYNYRMDSFQGAVLGVKMRHIEDWTEARCRLARVYDRELDALGIVRPRPPGHCRHVYHVYAARLAQRAAVQERLNAAGIGTNIHYPIPVHLQPAFADLGHGPGSFPVTEALSAELLSLPMYSELTEDQAIDVCSALGAACEGRAA